MKTIFKLLIFNFFHFWAAAQVPTSERSRQVVKRLSPILQSEFANKNLKWGSPVFIRIFKESDKLELWVRAKKEYSLFKAYNACYFSGKLGPKTKEGDNQAPEGFYEVRPKQLNPSSNYHLAFNLGYPNKYDQSHSYSGSALMVHGNCVSIGCYAMTDERIEEIYTLMQTAFENGQKAIPVHCFPFEMTKKQLEKRKDNKHFDFWINLSVGYEAFEQTHLPPTVNVKQMKYVFE